MARPSVTERASRRATSARPAPAHARPRRRRRGALLLTFLVVLAAFGVAWYEVHQAMPAWYARLWYPLHYEEPIRAEAARNALDPALVAAVIDTESGYAPDSRSPQGAVGLMQLLPETAQFVATLPRRPSPSPDDLETPEVNIAYGARYLRYLLDRHGSLDVALAAYNAGETNVARWIDQAAARGQTLHIPDDIPFPETRSFVRRVDDAVPIYRRAYGDRLGPPPAPPGAP
ncbi:MAG: lytic transglycosylase domain-containing protein [Thermoleophilia bacterium]